MKHFFISYNVADRPWAEWIAWRLEAAGYTTVIDTRDFLAGTSFVHAMERATQESERTIAVLSPDYLKALYTHAEWESRFLQDPAGVCGRLVPVRVRPCDLPALLQRLVYIDLTDLGDEAAVTERLLSKVGQLVALGASPRLKPMSAPPFPLALSSSATSARIAAPTSAWNVPLPRNRFFTGRDQVMAGLGEIFKSERSAVYVLHGLGGIGKTQIALEYCYQFRSHYPVVWWLRAEETATLAADYASLAQALDLPAQHLLELSERIAAVRRWLEQHPRWLLIFDNAQSPVAIRDYLPRSDTGHVLITSRNPQWGTLAQPLPIEVLERPDSVRFITGRLRPSTEAEKLAELLGDLPLALEQAVAYIEATGNSLKGYIRLFLRNQPQMLAMRQGALEAYPASVATTWQLALERLEQEAPAAVRLLTLCAFLAPDAIGRDLLQAAAQDWMAQERRDAFDAELLVDQALAAVTRYSLVALPADRTQELISIHRLVQAVVRQRLSEVEQAEAARAAVRLVGRLFPDDVEEVALWARCAELLPHALAAVGHASISARGEAGLLLAKAGAYLLAIGQYAEALPYAEEALEIRQEVLSPEHPDIAQSLNNLGTLYLAQDDLPTARAYFEQALAIRTKVYGPRHYAVAAVLRNLGVLCFKEQAQPDAISYLQRAIAILQEVHPQHPDLAVWLRNLGDALQASGNLAGAVLRFQQALTLAEQSFGAEHLHVARAARSIGVALVEMRRFTEAYGYLQRAFAIHLQRYGEAHAEVKRDHFLLKWAESGIEG